MSAFPPTYWEFPIRPELITSDNPMDHLAYQEELVRRLVDVNGALSNAIYGESGKWAPVAQGASTAGTGTYEVQVGYYVRWGNMVWFTLNLQWDDANHTGTGNLEITGLPVSAYDLTNAKVVCSCYNAESGSEFVGMAFIEPAESKISVIKSGATTQQINGADYDLQITGTYRAL